MRSLRYCVLVFGLLVCTLAVDLRAEDEAKRGKTPADMALIAGKEFMAGLNPDTVLVECRKYNKKCIKIWFENEKPQQVSVGTFSMDKHEVTQKQYQKVMGKNPSKFKGATLPVESVTWQEANEFCQKAGKRLPTEWEWEYAARCGKDTIYQWGGNGDDAARYAWYEKNAGGATHPVGQKKPNGCGLYDMAGNVYEWTASRLDDSGEFMVLRGSSWNAGAFSLRPSARVRLLPTARLDNLGFRCVR